MPLAVRILPGSSPRMRGALGDADVIQSNLGIIPADAGSTEARLRSLPSTRDHPRGCGEHGRKAQADRIARGSSPRMRGAHRRSSSDPDTARIIPADAGSTSTVI